MTTDSQRGEYIPLQTTDPHDEEQDDLPVGLDFAKQPPTYESIVPDEKLTIRRDGLWEGLAIGFLLMFITEYLQGVIASVILTGDGFADKPQDAIRSLIHGSNPLCGFEDIFVNRYASTTSSFVGFVVGTKDLFWVMAITLFASVAFICHAIDKTRKMRLRKGSAVLAILLFILFCGSVAGIVLIWTVGVDDVASRVKGLPGIWEMIQPYCNNTRIDDKNFRDGRCRSLN